MASVRMQRSSTPKNITAFKTAALEVRGTQLMQNKQGRWFWLAMKQLIIPAFVLYSPCTPREQVPPWGLGALLPTREGEQCLQHCERALHQQRAFGFSGRGCISCISPYFKLYSWVVLLYITVGVWRLHFWRKRTTSGLQ